MKNSIRVKLKKTISLLSACTLLVTSVAPLAETVFVTDAYAAEEAMEIPDEEVTEIPEAPDYEEAAVEVPDAGSEAGDPEYPDEELPDEAESSDSSEAVDEENAESDASLAPASSGSKKGIIYWNSDTPAVFLEGATDTVRVTVSAGIGAFPEGVAMKLKPADDEKTLSRIKKTVEKDGETKVADVLAVDITFVDAEGYEIEPAAPICVTMTDLTRTEIAGEIDQHGNEIRIEAENPTESAEAASNEASEDAEQPDADENEVEIAAEDGASESAGTAVAVHIDDKGRGELLPTPTDIHIKWNEEEIEENTKALQEVFADSSVIFEAEKFSVYAIVYTESNTETISDTDTDDSETEGDSELSWPGDTPSVFLEGDTDEVHVTVAAGVGVLPEGVTMTVSPVTDEDVLNRIRAAAEEDSEEAVAAVQAVDILFFDADGNEVKPAGTVCVTMKDLTEEAEASTENNVAVSLDADGNSSLPETPEEIHIEWKDEEIEENTAALQQVFADSTVIFETEDPGVCAIVTRTIEKTLEASDGNTYVITVNYDNTSGIPANAELKASEIKADDAAYESYVEKSAEAVGEAAENVTMARAFDISLVNPETGEEYQPDGSVKVTIELLNEDISGQENLNVVHFPGAYSEEPADGEVLENSLNEGHVEFETNGFSVYVVVSYVLRQTLTASDGNEYSVTVTYDNASGIPSDAELYVSEIKEGETGYEEYVAQSAAALGEKPENLAFARPFDITLKNPRTGEEYQPNGNVQVSIELLKDELSSYASVDVVHIPDGAGEEAQVMDTTVHGEAVEFETDGFSVYVLIGSSGEIVTPQCTYTFYVPDTDRPGQYKEYPFTDSQGRTIYRQTIISGEELIVPQLTSTDTEVFSGWYKGSTIGGTLTLDTEPYDFDNITITENSAIDLYAVYQNYAVVIFHDQYDSSSRTFPVAYTRRVELSTTGEGEAAITSATVKISDLSTTYTSSGGANMAFFGWSEKPITTPGAAKDDEGNDVAAISTDAEGCITVTGEKHLYPIFKEVHRLTYYAAQSGLSAAYVPPAQFFKGDPVSYSNNGTIVYSLPVTSRDGYTFLGWWTGTLTTNGDVETVNYGAQVTGSDGSLVASADDGGVYISGGKLYLRSDAVLYAKWEASYSIVYWKQVTTETPETVEKHYEYAETVTKTAQIGDTASVAEGDRANDRYDGYVLGHYDASVVIGNTKALTVLNVYYDLSAEHTASGQAHTLTFADSVTGEGAATMPDAAENLAYQTALKDYIPAAPTSGRISDSGKAIYNFDAWYMDQACTVKANLETMTMPDNDLTVYAGWTAIKFRVDIDPNYGALYAEENGSGTGATYFSNTYADEPIGEYTHATRDYVESSSGTW
ncbi:MAG: InlB B-repeat-containing protein, partial [Lachnospiraceae bacterium]|nr:InlB B-repeat-containing protein [Lachnospiraceae bacterium]